MHATSSSLRPHRQPLDHAPHVRAHLRKRLVISIAWLTITSLSCCFDGNRMRRSAKDPIVTKHRLGLNPSLIRFLMRRRDFSPRKISYHFSARRGNPSWPIPQRQTQHPSKNDKPLRITDNYPISRLQPVPCEPKNDSPGCGSPPHSALSLASCYS